MFSKLNKLGVNQTVFVPFKNHLDISSTPEYEVFHSVCYKNLDRFFFFRKSNKVYKSLLNNINNINDLELVHAHTLFSNGIIAYKLKKDFNIEYVVSVRNTDIEAFYKRILWLRKTGINILLEAKKIIFVSFALKNNLMSLINDKSIRDKIEENSEVMTNGINDFWLNNINKKSIPTHEKYNILQVGWINANKNQLNSIKAIEILNEKGFECNLTIVGDIEYKKHKKYKQKIDNYIQKCKCKEQVFFLGRQNMQELIKTYRNSDIFLMPSFKETFGLVFVEALSQGLPIIYTKNQGVDGLFNEYPVGEGINPNEPNNIADGIITVINNYKSYSDNTVNQVERFSWNNIASDIVKIYED